MKQRKKFWIVTGAIIVIVIGLVAHTYGWVKPINPAVLMTFEPGSYTVKTFLDGDTVVVTMNGTDETVRFIGVDTPETHKPNSPVQCYGPEAASYTKQRIGDRPIRLVADHLTTNRDRYNRLLRYVVLDDGTYLNQELVAKGYAFAYSFPFAELKTYAETMDETKLAGRGLWGNCTPTQDLQTGQWHSNDVTDPVL